MVIRAVRAASLALLLLGSLLGSLLGATACSSLSVVRVQSDNVYVGPNLRPIAVVQAQATTAYVLFIPLPGGVDLDRVVNRMLIVAAKTLGADKVANLQVDITPDSGVWTLRKIIGWRSAQASGVAVVVDDPVDAGAASGPEPVGGGRIGPSVPGGPNGVAPAGSAGDPPSSPPRSR
jgi:hypothetical protein